jgi:hypothetical protein
VSAVISGYCYYNVGAVCAATGADSYKEAWVRSVGASTAWIPSTAIVSQTAVATICYAIIIGDVMRDIAASSGVNSSSSHSPLCKTRSHSLMHNEPASVHHALIRASPPHILPRLQLTGALANRDVLLTSMGAFVLLPLCLLRDFGMLAYTRFNPAPLSYISSPLHDSHLLPKDPDTELSVCDFVCAFSSWFPKKISGNLTKTWGILHLLADHSYRKN